MSHLTLLRYSYILLLLVASFSCTKEEDLLPDEVAEHPCQIAEVGTPIIVVGIPPIMIDTIYYPYAYDSNNRLIERYERLSRKDSLVYQGSSNRLAEIFRINLQFDIIEFSTQLEYNERDQIVVRKELRDNGQGVTLIIDSLYYEEDLLVAWKTFYPIDLDSLGTKELVMFKREEYEYEAFEKLSKRRSYFGSSLGESPFYTEEFFSNYTLIRNPHYKSVFSDERETALFKYLFSTYRKEENGNTVQSNTYDHSTIPVNEFGYPDYAGSPTKFYTYYCK